MCCTQTPKPTIRIVRLDDAISDFLKTLEWPHGVPVPSVDAAIVDGKPMLRFSLVALSATDEADYSSLGVSPIEAVTGVALIAEAWCRRHKADPGSYPTGIRAQVTSKLDLRMAASWLYSLQLAGIMHAVG